MGLLEEMTYHKIRADRKKNKLVQKAKRKTKVKKNKIN